MIVLVVGSDVAGSLLPEDDIEDPERVFFGDLIAAGKLIFSKFTGTEVCLITALSFITAVEAGQLLVTLLALPINFIPLSPCFFD